MLHDVHAFFVSDIAESKKAGFVFHFGSKPEGGANGDQGWMSGTYSIT
jgi:hypothetical protein